MSSSEVARRYFDALDAHDLDAASACWKPGDIDYFVAQLEVVAPDGVRDYFAALFDAFPDFQLEVMEVTAHRGRAAVRGRATGTFAGPGQFEGFHAADRAAAEVYTLDPQAGVKGGARVPLGAFNIDTEQARASIRKLGALAPRIAWAGHADPVTGDVRGTLERAASA